MTIFDGWRVIAGLFIIMAISSGLGFYNQAVMIRALVGQSGFDITHASNAAGLFFLISGIARLPVASRLERNDARIIIVTGALV